MAPFLGLSFIRLFAISVNMWVASGDSGMDRNALEFRGEVVTDVEGLHTAGTQLKILGRKAS